MNKYIFFALNIITLFLIVNAKPQNCGYYGTCENNGDEDSLRDYNDYGGIDLSTGRNKYERYGDYGGNSDNDGNNQDNDYGNDYGNSYRNRGNGGRGRGCRGRHCQESRNTEYFGPKTGINKLYNDVMFIINW